MVVDLLSSLRSEIKLMTIVLPRNKESLAAPEASEERTMELPSSLKVLFYHIKARTMPIINVSLNQPLFVEG